MRNTGPWVIFACFIAALAVAQNRGEVGLQSIRSDDLKSHIYFLAADEMKGRDSLSPEARIAANYIAASLMRAGVKPLGDNATFFQNFPMVQQSIDRQQSFVKASFEANGMVKTYTDGSDYTLPRNGADFALEGPLVFGGYGDDDFQGVDVRGRIVLLLTRPATAGESRYGNRMNVGPTKTDVAAQKGAIAVLTVRNLPGTPTARPASAAKSGPVNAPIVTGMRPAGAERMTAPHMLAPLPSDIPNFAIAENVADELLAPTGRTVRQFRDSPQSTPVSGVRVQLRRVLKENRTIQARNVIGVLEGADPKLRDEYILVTAHLDHVGAGGDAIFHGADDNASACAAAIAIAEAFALGKRPDRSIVFLVFEAEEDGMLGSAYYAAHPILPLTRTVAVLNMDMIGRDEAVPGFKGLPPATSVNLVGTQFNPDLRAIIERANRSIGLGLDYKTDTNGSDWFQRSDHISFAARGIPMVLFNTGEHADYHTPNDTWDRINYPKLERIARLVYLTARDLSSAATPRPRFVPQTGR